MKTMVIRVPKMTAMIDAPNLDLPPEITGYQELKPHCAFEANQRFFTV